jgi:hypothetical protein
VHRNQDDDMVKNHRRRQDARRHQGVTGESLQTAVAAVRGRPSFGVDAMIARKAMFARNISVIDEFSRKRLGLANATVWRSAVEVALSEYRDDGATDEALRARLMHRVRQLRNRVKQRGRVSSRGLLGSIPGPEDRYIDDRRIDPRLIAVFNALSPSEAEALMLMGEAGKSWADVTSALGYSSAYAATFRHKVRRIALIVVKRSAVPAAREAESA